MFRNALLALICSLSAFFSCSDLAADHTFSFSEYKVTFPDNWKEIPAQDLKSYLGYYQRSSSTNPCWNDPAFVRGWNECKPGSDKRLTMGLIYRVKNDQKLSLEACTKMLEQRYANKDSPIKDFVVKAQGDALLNGVRAKWFDATMKIQDEKTEIRHYIVLSGEYAHYFYFTTTPKNFKKIRDQLTNIAQSFFIQS